MLQALTIEHIALIDQLYLEFAPGLNMLTGETGAGKSIVIDAIHTVLGGRASKDTIQAGRDTAKVEAVFAVNWEQAAALRKLEIDSEGGSVVFHRVLQANGKSVCRINGRMTTLSQLKQAAGYLMEIHGQHENQVLFSKANHLHLLDGFGGNPLKQAMHRYQAAYRDYIRYKRMLREKNLNPQELSSRLAVLRESYHAFEVLKWHLGEQKELEEKIDLLSHREAVMQAIEAAYGELYEKDGSGSESVQRAVSAMESIAEIHPSFRKAYQKLQEISFGLEDAVLSLRELRQENEFDPMALEEMQKRLYAFSGLQKQVGGEENHVLQHFAKMREEIEEIEEHLSHAGEYEKALKEKLRQVRETAEALSRVRHQVAKDMGKALLQQLADLGMDKASFQVDFSVKPLNASGMDEVEFLFSANVGEPVKPLIKVASGGEISRIMLAFKNLEIQNNLVDSMVFDEIDTGISGKMAQAVAEKLFYISRKQQVLCVTHLPQVAAMADHHFHVEKFEQKERMHVTVQTLDEAQRIEEVARLISGKEITEIALTHAAELVKAARQLTEKD